MADPVNKYSIKNVSVSVFENKTPEDKTYLSYNAQKFYTKKEEGKQDEIVTQNVNLSFDELVLMREVIDAAIKGKVKVK